MKSQRMVPGLLALPSVSHQVWVSSQREDPSLKSLFDAVLSPEVEECSANGTSLKMRYYCGSGLFMQREV